MEKEAVQARRHNSIAKVGGRITPLLGRTLKQFDGIRVKRETGYSREKKDGLYYADMPFYTSP